MTDAKFKVGDIVYDVARGVGKVVGIRSEITYCTKVQFDSGDAFEYTRDGFQLKQHLNPMLLTLEEARARGYNVPKLKVIKTITKYGLKFSDGSICNCIWDNPEYSIELTAAEWVELTISYEVVI